MAYINRDDQLPLFPLAIVIMIVGVVVMLFLEPWVGIWFFLGGLLILAFLGYLWWTQKISPACRDLKTQDEINACEEHMYSLPRFGGVRAYVQHLLEKRKEEEEKAAAEEWGNVPEVLKAHLTGGLL